ncbi:serine/threonine protein kinase [Nonomuraea sp. FMUSA5-5]|uniref:Serine/threonine protein kinase n=1 Tax=Nonomuraea composti TaxID=2720023 RepID=A0ABX1BJX0_9ACTN|nr:serine/threonine-protein kinase [Nonomuraea sp. FMUSA5-5]NJP98020.1 serine/threonine protein kinase [Nonomuraea sp. FMUSA5-5]
MVADRYRLDERIGSGPMGEVWRGYDTRADWVVAVKVLGARAAGAATREVLRQHAQAVARVIHPNVAMVLDVGEHEGAPFLVMEFLTGLSLGEELAARGPLRIVEVCDLIGQAAAGLDAAHRAGVVHGRVGPDSFRQASSGVLKVVGFAMDEREPAPAGSRYVAPERAAGEPARAPGDVYALGCVCYELLCGRPPFENGDATAQGQEGPGREQEGAGREQEGAGRGTPVPPSAIRPEVPAELDRLVLAMLAEDPARRPGSGEAIRRALAAIARPKPGQAAAPVTGVNLRDPGLTPGGEGARPGAGAGGDSAGGATEVFQAGAFAGPGGPPRAGDTAVFQAGDLEPERPSPPNRKLIIQLGIAVVAIAAVTVGMVMWAGAREEPPVAVSTPTAEATTPTPEPSILPQTSTIGPTPETEPTETEEEPDFLRETSLPKATLGDAIPPGGYAKWLQEFDEALMAQQSMGGIDPKVAGKARDKLRKAARKFDEGQVGPTLDQISGVYRDLAKAQEKGEMDPTGPAAEFLREWRLPDLP